MLSDGKKYFQCALFGETCKSANFELENTTLSEYLLQISDQKYVQKRFQKCKTMTKTTKTAGFVQFKESKAYADQIAALPDVRQKRIMKGEEDQLFLTRMQAVLAEKQKSPGSTHKVQLLENLSNNLVELIVLFAV